MQSFIKELLGLSSTNRTSELPSEPLVDAVLMENMVRMTFKSLNELIFLKPVQTYHTCLFVHLLYLLRGHLLNVIV